MFARSVIPLGAKVVGCSDLTINFCTDSSSAVSCFLYKPGWRWESLFSYFLGGPSLLAVAWISNRLHGAQVVHSHLRSDGIPIQIKIKQSPEILELEWQLLDGVISEVQHLEPSQFRDTVWKPRELVSAES